MVMIEHEGEILLLFFLERCWLPNGKLKASQTSGVDHSKPPNLSMLPRFKQATSWMLESHVSDVGANGLVQHCSNSKRLYDLS